MLTPLTATGEPDLAEVEKLVELFLRQKLDGLYILGSTGQWPLLRPEHRQAVTERVVRVAARRIPVMVHVGAASTDEAAALARHAARVGADAVSSVAPIYYSAGTDVIFEHYRRIGSASDLPFFVYHFGPANQLALDPREYAERLLAVPHIAGMKITDHDLYQFGLLQTFTRGRLVLFSGVDELLCHAALSGASGAIGTFYNLWGPPCQAVRRAFMSGHVEAARHFMLTFQRVIAEIGRAGSPWGFLHAAMRWKYDINVGPARAPLGLADRPWSDPDVERLVRAMEDAATGVG
jgi:N-acetylneuraminate lyase